MSARKFNFVIAFLCLVAFNLARADNSPTNTIQWGKTSEGFQLGIKVEDSAGVIHCWLRNATTNELICSSFAIGRWDSVNVTLKVDGEMKLLPRTASDFRAYEGIGPRAYPTTNFSPNVILSPISDGRELGQRRFEDYALFLTNRFALILRTNIPSPSEMGATFTVDLLDFDWPKDCFTNITLSVQVIETLARETTKASSSTNQARDWNRQFEYFQIPSAEILVNAKKIEALFAKLPPDKPEDSHKLATALGRPLQTPK